MEVSKTKRAGNNKFFSHKLNVLTVTVIGFLALASFFLIRLYVQKKYIYPMKYGTEIITYADKYGLERSMVFAIVKSESGFNVFAESNKGAKGLMQITVSTANYIAERLGFSDYDLFDAETNLEFGCYYMKYLITKFNYIDTALVAYNAGEGKVYEWLSDSKYSIDGRTLREIPYKESKEYVQKIYKTSLKYKKLYGDIVDKR
ncbi:MAG: lytic transglycosylase domain-containing protein [Clostridia bacterium]|nr:lytic transglycosylase domain-containing protein [Clostridia bacterium]